MVVMEEEVRYVNYMVHNFTSGIFRLQYSMGGRINDVAKHQVEFLEAISSTRTTLSERNFLGVRIYQSISKKESCRSTLSKILVACIRYGWNGNMALAVERLQNYLHPKNEVRANTSTAID